MTDADFADLMSDAQFMIDHLGEYLKKWGDIVAPDIDRKNFTPKQYAQLRKVLDAGCDLLGRYTA